MTCRLFTPASARLTLAVVRPAAESMCRLFRVLERHGPGTVAPERRVPRRYFELVRRLHGAVDRIHATGARVRDPRRGVLDFPALRGGRIVLLCWKVGETSIGYWHEPAAGTDDRRPVDEDGPWEEEEDEDD
jgi:hypothetical protein